MAKTTDGATLGRLSSVQHILGEFTQNPTTEGGGSSRDQDSGRHKDRPRITQTADSDDQTVAQGTGPRNSAQANNSSFISSSGTQASSRSNGSTGSSSSSGRSSSTHDAPKSGAANAAGKRQQPTAGDPVSLVYNTPMAQRADRILSLPTPKDKEEFFEVLRAAVFGSETIPIETRDAHMKWTGKTDNEFAEMEAVVTAWRQVAKRLISSGRDRFRDDSTARERIDELESELNRLTPSYQQLALKKIKETLTNKTVLIILGITFAAIILMNLRIL